MAKTKKTKTDPSEKARQDILAALISIAAFDGWNTKSLREAAKEAGLPKGADELYFPGGALEALRLWSDMGNKAVEAHFAAADLSEMRIRDKVTQGVLVYLEAMSPNDAAGRRALSRLALPDAVGQGPKMVWDTADTIWRAIGDTSTDFNFYSKRTILSGVISSTLLKWLADNDPEKVKSRKFLDARIANVMSFEKAKWEFKKRTENLPNPAEVLGKLRYGKRRRRRKR